MATQQQYGQNDATIIPSVGPRGLKHRNVLGV